MGKVDSHKNAEICSVLESLGKMAAKRHVTVIANTHISKAACGSANSRVIGSVAFVNHARAAFIVTADPEDSGRRLFKGESRQTTQWPRVPDCRHSFTRPRLRLGDMGAGHGSACRWSCSMFYPKVRRAKKKSSGKQRKRVSLGRTIRRAKDLRGAEAIREGGISEKGRWIWRLTKKPKVSTSEFGDLSHLSQFEPPKVPKCPRYRLDILDKAALTRTQRSGPPFSNTTPDSPGPRQRRASLMSFPSFS